MKLQFDSNQQYQLDAIHAVTNLFEGQPLNKGDFEMELPRESGQMVIDGGLVVGNNLLINEEKTAEILLEVQARNGLAVKERKGSSGRLNPPGDEGFLHGIVYLRSAIQPGGEGNGIGGPIKIIIQSQSHDKPSHYRTRGI